MKNVNKNVLYELITVCNLCITSFSCDILKQLVLKQNRLIHSKEKTVLYLFIFPR